VTALKLAIPEIGSFVNCIKASPVAALELAIPENGFVDSS